MSSNGYVHYLPMPVIDLWPKEADVVDALSQALWRAHITFRREIALPAQTHRSGKMRIDVGIFSGKRLVMAIECKRPGKQTGTRTRQQAAYYHLETNYGIPCRLLSSFEAIPTLIEEIAETITGMQPLDGRTVTA